MSTGASDTGAEVFAEQHEAGTDLTDDLVESVAGTIETGKTIEIGLDDGTVLVARVRQRQSGPIRCPVEGCIRRFDSERAKKTHVGKMHPERREAECAGCGDSFIRDRPDQTYCSKRCSDADRVNKTGLSCEECGTIFHVKSSAADNRQFCSQACESAHCREERECAGCGQAFECYKVSDKRFCSRSCYMTNGRGNVRETRSCAECGDSFETYPSSQDQTFCSKQCYWDSRWTTKTCPTCGREFETKAGNKQQSTTHCNRWCSFERTQHQDRPDTPRPLVEELLAEYDDQESLVGRTRANLPDWSETDCRIYVRHVRTGSFAESVHALLDEDLTAEDTPVGFRLLELCRQARNLSWRLDPPTIITAIDAADSAQALAEELSLTRRDADVLLEELGIADGFDEDTSLLGGDRR